MSFTDKLKRKGRYLTFLFAGVAATFVDSSPQSRSPYPDRTAKRIADCTFAGQPMDDVPPGAFDLWRNLEVLKEKSPTIGKDLFAFAKKADLRYCPVHVPNNIVANYNVREGVIDASIAYDKRKPYLAEIVTLVQARETRRAMLGWNEDTGPSGATLAERQKRALIRTAADGAMMRLVVLDLIDNGSKELAPVLMREQALLTGFLSATAKGALYEEALSTAAVASMEQMLRSQEWLNDENASVLVEFLIDLAGNRVLPPTLDTFSFAEQRRSGYVSDDFNFTANMAPMATDLFGKNTRMKEAFAYFDAVHKGEDTKNSPYHGLSATQVLTVWQKNGGTILETMDTLAGRPPLPKEKAKPAKPAAQQQQKKG